MITKIEIQRVKDAANIVDVVGEYLTLKREGSSYKGHCPFHADGKTPNLHVSAAKQIFTCFACGEKGDVFTFVSKIENITPAEAIRKLASKYHIILDGEKPVSEAKPLFEKVPAQAEYSFDRKQFTQEELALLGKNISAEACEKEFNLFSLRSYTTPANAQGISWRISSTPEYPIFVYDFVDFGRIYKPKDDKSKRFSFFGHVPKDAVFGDSKVRKLYALSEQGIAPEPDEKLTDLIIVSGGSDALNTRCNGGYHVAWLNSETALLSEKIYWNLKRIAKEIYMLYDIDNAGMFQAQRNALKFIDLRVIYLPEDLRNFRDWRGNPCKDVKDFFQHYKSLHYTNIGRLFKDLVRTSLSMMFWTEKEISDKDGNLKEIKYGVSNERVYGFLNAQGLYTMSDEQERRKFRFVRIQDKVVSDIHEEEITREVNNIMRNYLRTENIQHYNVDLMDAISNSNRMKLASLDNLRRIELDFRSFSKEYDCFFFQNTVLRISKEGVKPVKYSNFDKYIHDFSIVNHNFTLESAPFEIELTPEWKNLRNKFRGMNKGSDAYKQTEMDFEKFPDTKKYILKINDKSFSFLKYIYNTGRIYWQAEEKGEQLTSEEQAAHELNFINKICMLGYLMYRYKDSSRPYFIYGMETNVSNLGEHEGGTGKSLMFKYLNLVRRVANIAGQKNKMEDNDTLFSGVEAGRTNIVYFDDLGYKADLNTFLTDITGSMTVRSLYKNTITIPYSDSPKVAITSNHSPMNLKKSLKRRTWFTLFSDYYHPSDELNGQIEWNPRIEFGKNLVDDYDEREMNKLYNLFAYSVHTYLKLDEKVNPTMEFAERRNLQREIGEDFIFWAEDYFTPNRLNVNIEKHELFESYKLTFPEKIRDMMKLGNFKNKLVAWCRYKKFVFNPQEMMKSKTEKDRNEIRVTINGTDVYYWHIRTGEQLNDTESNDSEDVFVF
jgi:hypothetical protein